VLTVLLIGLALGTVVVAVKWGFGRSAAAQAREIERLELTEFNQRLLGDIQRGRRPVEHLALTRHMCGILRAVEVIPAPRPGSDHVAVLEPTEPLDRVACEELVALGRLQRPRPGIYLPAASGPPRGPG
jgi:hypothetical protein